MTVIRHWPERIVAVTDGEDTPGALIEYRRLEADEHAERCDVEYVRADLHRGAVEALRYIAGEDVAGFNAHQRPEHVAHFTLARLGVEPYASGGQ